MAGILLPMPRLGISALAGAQLFVYEPGTTTKRDTYTTSALSVANANPVVADAAGLFPAIFIDSALGYKVLLGLPAETDPPTGTPIFTQDNAHLAPTFGALSLTSLTVSGATALASLTATTGSFSGTLGVGGATALAAMSATTGSFSGAINPAAGIQFPATQAVSTDANNLDDYKEGTWTPVIGGSAGTSGQTYAVQVGLSVKKGQDVTLYFKIQLSAKGVISGNVQIQGIPAAYAAHASFGGCCSLCFSALGTNWVNVVAEVAAGAVVADVTGAQAATTSNLTALVTADITDSTILRGSLSYRAAA